MENSFKKMKYLLILENIIFKFVSLFFCVFFLILIEYSHSYQYLYHSNRPFPIELKNRDVIFSNYSGNFLIKIY